MSRILIIAPHPDDEVLGCGGTIARSSRGGEHVTVAIMTKGWPPLFPEHQVERVRNEARQAADELGVQELLLLDLPVTTLHLEPKHELNGLLDGMIGMVQPDTVFLPHPGDRHEDHRQIFDAAMVALRPDGRRHRVSRVACYETVSETHWSAPGIEPAFEPNWYVDISETLTTKLAAMKRYASQLEEAIPARSLEAIDSLARFRGSVVGLPAAEAFCIVREVSAGRVKSAEKAK